MSASEVMKLINRITVIKSEVASQQRNHKAIKAKVREASLSGNEERAESLDEVVRSTQARIDRMNEDVIALEAMMPDAIKADALPQMKILRKQYDDLYQIQVTASQKLKQALEAAMEVLEDATASAMKAEILVRQSDQLSHDTGLPGIKGRLFPMPGREEAEMAGTIRNHVAGAETALGQARNVSARIAQQRADKRNEKAYREYTQIVV